MIWSRTVTVNIGSPGQWCSVVDPRAACPASHWPPRHHGRQLVEGALSVTSPSNTGSASSDQGERQARRQSSTARCGPGNGPDLRALERMPRRRNERPRPAARAPAASPYQLRSITVASGASRSKATAETLGRPLVWTTRSGPGRRRRRDKVGVEARRDVGTRRDQIHQLHRQSGSRRPARDQQADRAAPTTVTRSPRRGAASHSALTAVSTLAASTARAVALPAAARAPRRRDVVGRLVRVQAEHRAPQELGRPVLHHTDAHVAVLHRRREVAVLERRAHRRVLVRRHPPRYTSLSVPRLMPVRMVRTTTSVMLGSGSVTGRISPWPGARSQNACAISRPFSRESRIRFLWEYGRKPRLDGGGRRVS